MFCKGKRKKCLDSVGVKARSVQQTAPLSCFFLNLFLHLQPIFDWNVKQLFLYLSAEYATKSNVSHHTHTQGIFFLSDISVQLKISRMKTCISKQIWDQKLAIVTMKLQAGVSDRVKWLLTIKFQDGATECFCSHTSSICNVWILMLFSLWFDGNCVCVCMLVSEPGGAVG